MNADSSHSSPQSPDSIPSAPATGTIIAFDFGEKRIGIAIGDLAVRIAHPLTTIRAEDNARRFAEIQNLMREWKPVRLIVGLPMYADGTEHNLSHLARRFARRLEGRFNIPVTLVDERLTSRSAETRLKESGLQPERVNDALDAAAAREILEAFFCESPDRT